MSEQCDCPACTIGRTVEGLLAREINPNEILTGLLLHSVRIAGDGNVAILEAPRIDIDDDEPEKLH